MKTVRLMIQMVLLMCLTIGVSACNSSKKTTSTSTPTSTSQRPANQEARTQNGRSQNDPFAALNMSDDQKAKFRTIKDKYRKEAKTARENAGGDRSAMKTIMDSIRDREQGEIKNLLTAKQFKQYVEIMKEMKPRQGRPGGGQGRRGQGNK